MLVASVNGDVPAQPWGNQSQEIRVFRTPMYALIVCNVRYLNYMYR